MEVLAGSGSAGFADGAGAAAQFDGPDGVAVDGGGSIIIATRVHLVPVRSGRLFQRVRKITPDGRVLCVCARSRRACP
jgi:hypothetical protein